MKKLLISLFFVILFLPSTYAQISRVGVATGYNHNYHFYNEQFSDHLLTKYPFLSFNAIYELSLPFNIVPRLNFYIPNVYKEEISADYTFRNRTAGITLDIDGHYVFNSFDQMEVYGLAGVNMLFAWRKSIEEIVGTADIVDKSNTTAFGLNIGAGGYWQVKDQFDLFVEGKAILTQQVQFVISVGILMNLEYYLAKRAEKKSGY